MSEQEFIQLKESLKSILRSKNHYILIYKVCDKKLKIEINKTPSDSSSGIKTVKDISNVIKRSGLVKAV